MLRASALYIVLFISLVIGVLCSAMIAASYLYSLEVSSQVKSLRVERNANSAIQGLLASKEFSAGVVDLYGEGQDSVWLQQKNWGAFDVAVVKAFSGTIVSKKVLMYGCKEDSLGKAALYMADRERPLSLAGSTKIKGIVYLPKAGVKSGNVEGVFFSGKELVEGRIKNSKIDLPALSTSLLTQLVSLVKNPSRGNYEFAIKENQDIERSFFDTTLLLHRHSLMRIGRQVIKGNVVIASDSVVVIGREAALSEVLVVAPAVVIEEGFSGSIQVFATDSIVVHKNCSLTYPSTLGLIKTKFDDKQKFIRVEENSQVHGLVFSYSIVDDLKMTLVKLCKKSRVEGQVYVQGYCDMQGEIYGTLVSVFFTLSTERTTVDNVLFNAVIDRSLLSPYYIGSSLLPSRNNKAPVKWLR